MVSRSENRFGPGGNTAAHPALPTLSGSRLRAPHPLANPDGGKPNFSSDGRVQLKGMSCSRRFTDKAHTTPCSMFRFCQTVRTFRFGPPRRKSCSMQSRCGDTLSNRTECMPGVATWPTHDGIWKPTNFCFPELDLGHSDHEADCEFLLKPMAQPKLCNFRACRNRGKLATHGVRFERWESEIPVAAGDSQAPSDGSVMPKTLRRSKTKAAIKPSMSSVWNQPIHNGPR